MPDRQALTVYKVAEHIDDMPVVDPTTALRSLDSVREPELVMDVPFEARLFVAHAPRRYPDWVDFLRPGFGDVFNRVRGAGAVLFVRPEGADLGWFAFTFGSRGRHLLRHDAWVRHYGLRTALNLIYSGQGEDSGARVRSVDSKTVSANTLRTRTQTDRRDAFEAFGVDARRDLLHGITGAPFDSETWGSRVSGSDRLAIHPTISLADLGVLCTQISEAHGQESYREHFEWIDHLATVTDPALKRHLMDRVVSGIVNADLPIAVAVPELISWDEIPWFCFSFEPEETFVDPEDADLSAALDRTGRLADLTPAQLRNRFQLRAVADDGDPIRQWGLFNCLSCELAEAGRRFVLSEGDFFEVSPGLLQELAVFVDGIQHSAVPLPPSPGDVREDHYLGVAAPAVNALLMDQRNVTFPGATSPVELCDLLTDDRHFVHAKRKLGSSQLSHLFSQGARSLELCSISRDFRAAALARIGEVRAEYGLPDGSFEPFGQDAVDPRTLTVDYAIIARWAGRQPSQALPFFSQLNLRRFVEDIERFGAHVTLTPIEVI